MSDSPDANMSGPNDWLTGSQREILEFLGRTRSYKIGGLWQNPAAIARNTSVARGTVNNQIAELKNRGYVETDGQGYYRITEDGINLLKEL